MIKLKKIKSAHPGEILMEEFLLPLGLSQTQLAKNIQVSPRIEELMKLFREKEVYRQTRR